MYKQTYLDRMMYHMNLTFRLPHHQNIVTALPVGRVQPASDFHALGLGRKNFFIFLFIAGQICKVRPCFPRPSESMAGGYLRVHRGPASVQVRTVSLKSLSCWIGSIKSPLLDNQNIYMMISLTCIMNNHQMNVLTSY